MVKYLYIKKFTGSLCVEKYKTIIIFCKRSYYKIKAKKNSLADCACPVLAYACVLSVSGGELSHLSSVFSRELSARTDNGCFVRFDTVLFIIRNSIFFSKKGLDLFSFIFFYNDGSFAY